MKDFAVVEDKVLEREQEELEGGQRLNQEFPDIELVEEVAPCQTPGREVPVFLEAAAASTHREIEQLLNQTSQLSQPQLEVKVERVRKGRKELEVTYKFRCSAPTTALSRCS